VELDLRHLAVRAHLLGAVEAWIREYGVDGLRLDATDCASTRRTASPWTFSASWLPFAADCGPISGCWARRLRATA
jgi:glycosidase